jgi:hypothetical protein
MEIAIMDTTRYQYIDLDAFNQNESIVSLAGRLGFDLKKSGLRHVAPCPLCQDTGNKRHLTFYPKTNSFICHKCNQLKGSNFGLIRYALNLDNKGAIDWIKNHFSIRYSASALYQPPVTRQICNFEVNPQRPETHRKIYETLFTMIDLPEKIKHYLSFDRAIADDTINRFDLRGISKNQYSLQNKLQKRFQAEDLNKSGILYQLEGKQPAMRFNDDCIVFPHYYKGNIYYLSCRNLNLPIKSFNLPQRVFFNLDALDTHKIVYVFEGIINGLSYYQLTGRDNFIATLGIISESQYQSLTQTYSDIDFRFLYDPDKPGKAKSAIFQADTHFYTKLFRSYGFNTIPLKQSTGSNSHPKEWDLNDLLIWIRDEYEERAAILEYCQGLSREEAEQQAVREINQRSIL